MIVQEKGLGGEAGKRTERSPYFPGVASDLAAEIVPLLDSFYLMSAIVRHDGVVLFCSKSLSGRMGFAKETIIGKSWIPAVSASDPKVEDTHWVFRIASGRLPFSCFDTWRTASGLLLPVTANLVSLKRRDGRVWGALVLAEEADCECDGGAGNDIPSRVLLEVGHEVNNMLQIIQAHCELVLDHGCDERETRIRMGHIQKAVRRIGCLSDRIMYRGHVVEADSDMVNVADVLDRAVRLVQTISDGDVTVSSSGGDRPLVIAGCRRDLERAFLSLLLHVCGAAGFGGHVAVRCDVLDRGPESLDAERCHANTAWLRVCITDSGSGILDCLAQCVFEPFLSTKSPGKGAGPGLHVVARIVEAHGGGVSVCNSSEGGAEFCIVLPCAV